MQNMFFFHKAELTRIQEYITRIMNKGINKKSRWCICFLNIKWYFYKVKLKGDVFLPETCLQGSLEELQHSVHPDLSHIW